MKGKAIMLKNQLRLTARHFLGKFGNKIEEKYKNICGKTGSYSVPDELFQKRTSRSNRVLLPWRDVFNNHITIEQLNTFEGGVVVEFLNNDFFDESYNNNNTYKELKNRLGSDDAVSSIISIRSEAGSSSSAVQRKAFEKLINNTHVMYKGQEITITKNNYTDFALVKTIGGKNTGNEVWAGFLFVSIKGGQQDKIETHANQELWLFNPACEYASSDVCLDIDLVLLYYGFLSIDVQTLSKNDLETYQTLMEELNRTLATIKYCNNEYCGDLLSFVKRQYCVSMVPGQLTDPIQLTRIDISCFNKSNREPDSIDLTHNEAVIFEKYYWDSEKQCILSPARPTNLFWSLHLSNMLQQNHDFDAYFACEKERFLKRQQFLNKNRES